MLPIQPANMNKQPFNHSLASARFSGAEKVVYQLTQKEGGALYKAAANFLTMHERFEATVVRPLLQSKNPRVKRIAALLNVVSKSFLPQDFAKRTPMFNWGKVGVRPPNGAMGITLYAGIIPSRIYAATKRPDVDKGEYLDILIRDVLGITFFLYALEPTRNLLGRVLEKSRGIKFIQHGEVLDYTTLDDMYRMTHPNRVLQLVRKPENHKAIHKIMGELPNHRLLKGYFKEQPEALLQFNRLKKLLTDMTTAVKQDKALSDPAVILNNEPLKKMAKESYHLIHELETSVNKRFFGDARRLMARGLSVGRLSSVPSFKSMFAAAANSSRVGIDLASLAIVTVLLGWGVTRFNEWFTEYRHQKEALSHKSHL